MLFFLQKKKKKKKGFPHYLGGQALTHWHAGDRVHIPIPVLQMQKLGLRKMEWPACRHKDVKGNAAADYYNKISFISLCVLFIFLIPGYSPLIALNACMVELRQRLRCSERKEATDYVKLTCKNGVDSVDMGVATLTCFFSLVSSTNAHEILKTFFGGSIKPGALDWKSAALDSLPTIDTYLPALKLTL